MDFEKLEQRYRDLCTLADNPAASVHEAQAARAAAERIAASLRKQGRQPLQYEQEPEPDLGPVAEPEEVPTISVHTARRHYYVAARYWCPSCEKGRNHSGDCPVCHGRTEVVNRLEESRVKGWL